MILGLAGCVGEDRAQNVVYGRDLSFIAGTVTDAATGRPLGGVYIYLYDLDPDGGYRLIPRGFTDENGRYAFALGWGSPITSSYYTFERLRYDSRGFQIPLEARQVSDLEFRLDVALSHSWVVGR